MRKTVFFFSCEPGGAEVLIPVIELLQRSLGYDVVVCGYGHAARRFADKGIRHVIVEPVTTPGGLERWKPDLVITSAASLPERDMSEKNLWHLARRNGIPSIAFLDQWQNYEARFSGASEAERLAFLPDFINCINAVGRREMTKAGFDERRLVEFGHPYLSALPMRAAKVDRAALLRRLKVDEDRPLILFASEAISEHYGRRRGYDQFDALRLFMEMVERTPEKLRPLIKLHPKDALPGYEEVLKEYSPLGPIVVRDELSPVECLAAAEMVFGMTSVMLIEAFILGKPVASLQPGLTGEDPMVLSRIGCIPRVVRREPVLSIRAFSCPPDPDAGFEYAFREQAFLAFIAGLLGV